MVLPKNLFKLLKINNIVIFFWLGKTLRSCYKIVELKERPLRPADDRKHLTSKNALLVEHL